MFSKRIPVKFLAFLLFSFLFSLFFSACSSSTGGDGNKVTFSGTVTLEGQTDYSGVTVSLYEPAELDTALLRINQEYPNIGVQISQETEFDHRGYEPVATTTTNADGSWEVKVDEGVYNVVAEKDGYGWRYAWNVSDNADITLKAKTTLAGPLVSSQNFENAFIEINNDILLGAQEQLSFSGINYVKFNTNSTFTIQGGFVIDNNAKLYLVTDNENVNAEIDFDDFENLVLKNIYCLSDIEININNSSSTISNSCFKNSNTYALREDRSGFTLENVIIKQSSVGFVANISDSSNQMMDNIFLNNDTDFQGTSIYFLNIQNNLFHGSNINLELVALNTNINHNEFARSEKNINMADESNIQVYSNNFFNNIINTNFTQVSHLNYPIQFVANNNNFITTQDYYFWLGPQTVKLDSVDAINNFWGTLNEQEIQNQIIDGIDFPTESKYAIVKFKPFEYELIEFAGIE